MKKIESHGMSKSPEYVVWSSMKQRCLNKKCNRYNSYGGRGISVCKRWMSFKNFISDMGKKPGKKYSIDRINNDGNYTPENCRWATRSEQQKNKKPYPSKNRLPKGSDHWTNKNKEKARLVAVKNIKKAHGSGESNPNAKMTRFKAKCMRKYYKLYPNTKMSILGAMFDVKRETARKVIKGISWL